MINKVLTFLFFFFLIEFLATSSAPAQDSQPDSVLAEVAWVRSGTVLELMDGTRVSVHGCYAPVMHDDDARDFTRDLVIEKTVLLTNIQSLQMQRDSEHNYWFAYVTVDDSLDLGEQLLQRGLAAADTLLDHPKLSRYRQLHEWAIANSLGYWGLPSSRRPESWTDTSTEGLAGRQTYRSREDLTLFFEQHRDNLMQCYRSQRRRNPSLIGRIRVQFVIQPDGSVTSLEVLGSHWNDPVTGAMVERCVLGKTARWHYWEIAEGTVRTEYSLIFR